MHETSRGSRFESPSRADLPGQRKSSFCFFPDRKTKRSGRGSFATGAAARPSGRAAIGGGRASYSREAEARQCGISLESCDGSCHRGKIRRIDVLVREGAQEQPARFAFSQTSCGESLAVARATPKRNRT